MRPITSEPDGHDDPLYRWWPEIETIRSGIAEAVRYEMEPDVRNAAEQAMRYLDLAQKSLQWRGMREIRLEEI